MNGAEETSGFGWILVIGGLVIAGIGLIWVLAPNLPFLGVRICPCCVWPNRRIPTNPHFRRARALRCTIGNC